MTAREGVPEGPYDVTVRASRGQRVLTPGDDEAWIAAGVTDSYAELSAQSLMVAASAQWPATPTTVIPPTLVEIRQATSGDPRRYDLTLLVTSDGRMRGRLFQETKATLTPESWDAFLRQQILPCLSGLPRPFRVALAVGGTSADASLGLAASADGGDLDHLPEEGGDEGAPIRLRELEGQLAALLDAELGATDPGEPVCSQVRIVRLVRHGGSLPVGLYVGLPSDRRVRAVLTPSGVEVTPLDSPGLTVP